MVMLVMFLRCCVVSYYFWDGYVVSYVLLRWLCSSYVMYFWDGCVVSYVDGYVVSYVLLRWLCS